jgi:hypothetical protein
VNDKQQAWQRKARSDARDAYLPPKLKTFGPVGALTQGGSGDMAEMGMDMGMDMGMGADMRPRA